MSKTYSNEERSTTLEKWLTTYRLKLREVPGVVRHLERMGIGEKKEEYEVKVNYKYNEFVFQFRQSAEISTANNGSRAIQEADQVKEEERKIKGESRVHYEKVAMIKELGREKVHTETTNVKIDIPCQSNNRSKSSIWDMGEIKKCNKSQDNSGKQEE